MSKTEWTPDCDTDCDTDSDTNPENSFTSYMRLPLWKRVRCFLLMFEGLKSRWFAISGLLTPVSNHSPPVVSININVADSFDRTAAGAVFYGHHHCKRLVIAQRFAVFFPGDDDIVAQF